MPKGSEGDTEASGRCIGGNPDTCHVAIGWRVVRVAIAAVQDGGLLQTRWLETRTYGAAGAPSLETGSWHRSYKKYGAELGRFLNSVACPTFLEALREELGNG